MAENVKKVSTKLKLINVAKVVGVCLGGVFGLIGVSLGIIALTGGFNPPIVKLEDLKFEQNVYVIDGNLEKTLTPAGDNDYYIDFKPKVDEEENQIYQTIKAIPTNEDCTELDATITIKSGNSIQLVCDENTKLFNQQEVEQDEKDNDDENQNEPEEVVWQSKYSVKLNSEIKVVPYFANSQNLNEKYLGGWNLLEIEQGMHLAYCYIFVDVPVYGYQITAIEKDGMEKYVPVVDNNNQNPNVNQDEEFVPDYLIDNTDSNGNNFAFTMQGANATPQKSFDTVYNVDPSLNTNLDLKFNLRSEIESLYSEKYKQIIYTSSDEDVATVRQNANNTATITLKPNSYGKTFEINSYVISIYNDLKNIPQLENYATEAEYNADFNKIRVFSINTLKFKVNQIQIETFEVAQNSIDYYVFDNSLLTLTRAGSTKPNTKNEDQSIFNFSIELNQHFSDEASRLDEILNNIEITAVYKNLQGEYEEYGENGAIEIVKDNLGKKSLVVKKQDNQSSYLKFTYAVDEESEEYVVYVPIKINVKSTTLSLGMNGSALALNYFAKPTDGTVGDSLNNNNDIATVLSPQLSNSNATYTKIMYFVNFAQNSEEFIQVDTTQKIKFNNEVYYALSYTPESDGENEPEALNDILRVVGVGSNAKLIAAVVKTELANGQGNLLVDNDGNIEYYAISSSVGDTPRYIAISAEQQLEIDKCVVVIGDRDSALDLDNIEDEINIVDLNGKSNEYPVIVLSKSQENLRYATLVLTYYGPMQQNNNFTISKSGSSLNYSEGTNNNYISDVTYDAESVYIATFSANIDGITTITINASSNPSWYRIITFNVTEDIINTLELSCAGATNNTINAIYNITTDGIEFDDIEFTLNIVPADSQSSTTFARAFTLSDEMITYMCNMLNLDITTATKSEILSRLNTNDNARKTLGDEMGDNYVVDITSYQSLDDTMTATINGVGDSIVIVFAMTNNQVSLASKAYLVHVDEFVLETNFEQNNTYYTLGDVSNKIVRIANVMNDGIDVSPTANSYDLKTTSFTLNENSIAFNALKFAFENGETTSDNGSTIYNGVITFGSVSERTREILYVYIGSTYENSLCKVALSFVLEPDYRFDGSSNMTYIKSKDIDLFELNNGVPQIIITNKDFNGQASSNDQKREAGNKLFLPFNYNLSKLQTYDNDFLELFYYSDAGGNAYHHIYLTLDVSGDILDGQMIGGLVKFNSAGIIEIVSNQYAISEIDINLTELEVGDLTYSNQDIVLNGQNIQTNPSSEISNINITDFSFDIDYLNEQYQIGEFSEEYDNLLNIKSLKCDLNDTKFDLLKITYSNGNYILTQGNDYDVVKMALNFNGINSINIKCTFTFTYENLTYTESLNILVQL